MGYYDITAGVKLIVKSMTESTLTVQLFVEFCTKWGKEVVVSLHETEKGYFFNYKGKRYYLSKMKKMVIT